MGYDMRVLTPTLAGDPHEGHFHFTQIKKKLVVSAGTQRNRLLKRLICPILFYEKLTLQKFSIADPWFLLVLYAAKLVDFEVYPSATAPPGFRTFTAATLWSQTINPAALI